MRRKGLVSVLQAEDQLMHLQWKDRGTGTIEVSSDITIINILILNNFILNINIFRIVILNIFILNIVHIFSILIISMFNFLTNPSITLITTISIIRTI